MQDIAYYNGEYSSMADMRIPLNDRAVYFGDGIYEVVYARNGRIFALREHMDRLRNSLKLAEIKPPMPFEEMERIIHEAVSKVDAQEQFVYFQISRGSYPRIHAYPPADVPANFLLFSRESKLRDVAQPVKLRTQEDVRWGICCMKSLNLLPNCMAAQRAAEAGCLETVLYRDGIVTECSSSNVFIVQDGVLRTAPQDESMLPGITRQHTLDLARGLGIPVMEEFFTLAQLYAADDVLVTSTSSHCIRAYEIDGKPVGGRAEEIVKKLQQAYQDKIAQEVGAL